MKQSVFTTLFILLFTLSSAPQDQAQLAPFGGSPGTPQSYYSTALDVLNKEQYTEGSIYLQEIINWFPDSEQAQRARELNTLIYRLHLTRAGDNRAFQPDNSFSAALTEIDDPGGLAVDSKNNVYYSDNDKKTLTVFDSSGKPTGTSTLLSPSFISVTDKDEILVANKDNAMLGNQALTFTVIDAKGNAQPLQEIRSLAVDKSGNYYVVSGKYPGILVFDANKSQISNSPFSMRQTEYYKVLVTPKNQICALDKDRKQIVILGTDGKAAATIGPSGQGYQLEKIEDFAVDSLNHIYLLEKNPRSVLIFSPSGSLLRYLLSDKKSPLVFDDARLIAIGPSGCIFLLNKDSHRILKLG